MVVGSSPLRATGGFARLLTSGPRGISRGTHKLAWTSIVIKKKKKKSFDFAVFYSDEERLPS